MRLERAGLLSDDKADKVIVTTIQKLGLALDENSKRNRQREKRGLETYRERLEPLRDKRVVLIFDECHRSQFGDNHDAIKEFFPRAQLFGFTGTPIFDENATQIKIDGNQASYRTTVETFERELHKYTITHAIEDRNVLKFHVDYYKLKGEEAPKPGRVLEKKAVVRAILDNHDAVSTAVAEEEVDLAATHLALTQIENRIRTATLSHNKFLAELRLAQLPLSGSEASPKASRR